MNSDNPILNSPCEEPLLHYATDSDSALDYSQVVKGRRIFTPDILVIPTKQCPQAPIFEINDNPDLHKTNIKMKKSFTIFLFVLFLSVSIKSNAQWVQISNWYYGGYVYSLASKDSNIFAGTSSGIFVSMNNGTSWTQTFNHDVVSSFAFSDSNIFAGTYSGIFVSANNGASWSQTTLNNRSIASLGVRGNNIFAGTAVNGIYRSTNNGSSWNQIALNNLTVYSLAVSGNNIFAGTFVNGVWLSTNNGANWTQTALNNQSVLALTVSGNNVFAGTANYGVYLSTNNGTTWSQTALNNLDISSFAISGSNVFVGTGGSGVCQSTNNGTSWIPINQGFNTIHTLVSLLIANNFILAGTLGNSVWRRPLSEVIGIQNISMEIPLSYSLSQNYPNPFNPITTIRYAIPHNGYVRLIVFDALGKEIETLVNEKQSAGTYEATFNASQLPSGVYFYRLTTDNFSDTMRMLLVK